MANPRKTLPRQAGVTLIELMVVLVITAIIVTLSTQTYISFVRNDRDRRKTADVQGVARFALEIVERDLRHASLGSGTGRIWTTSGLNRVSRPAVQIFSDVPGGGSLDLTAVSREIGDVKPGTDAVLVVEAFGGARAATVGEIYGATPGMPRTFSVSTLSNVLGESTHTLQAGDGILVGDYLDASWAVLRATDGSKDPPELTVAADLVLPGAQVPKIAAGSIVRRARARLYYVDARDQLVRLELAVPRAPAALDEIRSGEVLGRGIENLQIDCEQSSPGGPLAACAGALAAGHEIATESAALFGPFGAGAGPVFEDASSLRAVVFSLAARSVRPIADAYGDAAITLDGVELPVGEGADPEAEYVRRAYELTAGTRNTSLGAF